MVTFLTNSFVRLIPCKPHIIELARELWCIRDPWIESAEKKPFGIHFSLSGYMGEVMQWLIQECNDESNFNNLWNQRNTSMVSILSLMFCDLLDRYEEVH